MIVQGSMPSTTGVESLRGEDVSGKRRRSGSVRASQSVARLSWDDFGSQTKPRMANYQGDPEGSDDIV